MAAIADAAIGQDGGDATFGYVGGGGYTLPLYFEATYPAGSHVVYEIDKELVERVTSVLGIQRREARFPTRIGDARAEVATSPPKAMDIIVGDAFSGISVPWHLTTREFLEDIADLLKSDGLYLMNLIDYDHYDLARAEARTFRAVFSDVAVVAPSFVLSGSSGGGSNVLIIGGERLPHVSVLNDAVARTGSGSSVVAGSELDAFIGDAIQLTDDFAPADQLLGRP